jgi:hypothetical protein
VKEKEKEEKEHAMIHGKLVWAAKKPLAFLSIVLNIL